MSDVAALKRKRGVIDLDDLLDLVISSMDDPTFAAATRWRFRHFYVDEAQDLNPLQYMVLTSLLGDRTDLTLVGDPAQAIYGFNGSDPRFLSEVEKYFPGVEIIRLDTNYRCTPEIVATGLRILTDDPSPTPSLKSSRPSGIAPTAYTFDDEETEAAGIAQLIADAKPVFARWRDFAVLARTNAQLNLVHDALTNVGIPSMLSGVAADPVQRPFEPPASSHLDRDSQCGAMMRANPTPNSTTPPSRLGVGWLMPSTNSWPTAVAMVWFHAWVRTNRPFQADQTSDGVELLTFHAAKGREWFGVVWLVVTSDWFRIHRPAPGTLSPKRPVSLTSPSLGHRID